jgi:hypothetical protein
MSSQPTQPSQSQQSPASSGQAHQFAQDELIAAAIAPLVAQAFTVLDPTDLKGTIPKLKALIAAIIAKHGQMSASLAVRYYQLERKQAGITVPFKAKPAKPAGPDRIDPSIDGATKSLWGPVNSDPIDHKDAPLPSFDDRLAAALTNVQGVAENLTLDAGRQTVIDAVQADRQAIGWARVPEGAPCAFCALLCTRGAVYRSESSASFQTHDHCRCQPEAVFVSYEPSHQIREWQAQYADATRGTRGSKAAQLAWRRAYEGRTAPVQQPALV